MGNKQPKRIHTDDIVIHISLNDAIHPITVNKYLSLYTAIYLWLFKYKNRRESIQYDKIAVRVDGVDLPKEALYNSHIYHYEEKTSEINPIFITVSN